MPFTPDPQKQKNIAAIEKLFKDNNIQYDITLVTDSDILVTIAVMPKDYVEADVTLSSERITEEELHRRYKEEIE